jgi:hypothetical protein
MDEGSFFLSDSTALARDVEVEIDTEETGKPPFSHLAF